MTEFNFHLVEARLWCLSYPKQAEELALKLSGDSSANDDDRGLAVHILGVLCGLGNAGVESFLCRLATSDNKRLSETATWALARWDVEGRHRDLFRQTALKGIFRAIDVLGEWSDDISEAVLNQIASQGTTGRECAQLSLLRLNWLKRSDWAETVREILRDSSQHRFRHFDWALRVARQRRLPNLLNLLRERLRAAEQESMKRCWDMWDGLELDQKDELSRRDFTETFGPPHVDWYFDDILISYAELGGELTALEQARLRFLGHGKDARKRLFELMDSRE